ncbi:MAG: lysophospholipid acyltransferase family protein [Patescibacteria group bacterium]|nr:lysophospholipid acyltransferase family protein [Patescibacteria group bacterium]
MANRSTNRPLSSRIWYNSLQTLLQIAAVLGWRVRHSGRENIPLEGGVLVVSNHQSHLDPPLVGMGVPRRMNYLARESLFRFRPLGWLMRSVDAIPIDRDGIGLSGIKESLRRLKRGEMVVVFPEGTRSVDGSIQAFLPGVTTLAVRSRAAILPVAIEGAFEAWPRWRSYPLPGQVVVHYGEPILPDEVASMDDRSLLAEVETRVRKCHARLQSQRKRDTP